MYIKTRNDARADGDTYFYTGRECKRGHLERRYVSSGTCLGCERLRDKERYEHEREYRINKAAEWVANNKERKIINDALYEKNNRKELNRLRRLRYANNKNYRMSVSMRMMLRNTYYAFSSTKNKATETILGYSPADLVAHLEALFVEGMSWDNYGEWQIDHIKPIDAFVKEGVFDAKAINALSNLQPLWAKDNASKGNKYVR